MENLFIVLHVFIMLLLIAGLFVMQKKHVSFSKRVFTALGLGIVFGFALQLIYGPASHIVTQTADWFNIAGGGYVKLLQMIVMPLVFISILGAFTKLKLTHNIGKISGLIIGILIATTAIAAAVGIASACPDFRHRCRRVPARRWWLERCVPAVFVCRDGPHAYPCRASAA